MQCSGTIVNSVSFCLYVQNTYIHRYYAYVMYGVRARATEYLSNKHKRRSTYLTPWWPSPDSAEWRSAHLCPNLFHVISTYMEMPKNNTNRLPPFIASNSSFHDQLLWPLHPPKTAAKGPFRCLRSTAHSLLTFLEGLKGQSWGYIHLMETVEYASTCPRKNLEDCAALLNLGDNGSKWQKTGIWSQVSSGRMVIIMYAYIN